MGVRQTYQVGALMVQIQYLVQLRQPAVAAVGLIREPQQAAVGREAAEARRRSQREPEQRVKAIMVVPEHPNTIKGALVAAAELQQLAKQVYLPLVALVALDYRHPLQAPQ